MLKSNINIVSNVYIRSNEDIKKDYEYIRHITGKKRLNDIKRNYSGIQSVKMTEIQERIIEQTKPCHYAKNKEMSFGPVMKDGDLIWECRCEYKSCSLYSNCMKNLNVFKIERDEKPSDESEKEDDEFFKQPGVVFNSENLMFEGKQKATEEKSEEIKYEPKEPDFSENISDKYKRIESPYCIFNAPIDSHIIINSAPGTGKTYTIIRRLIYILSNQLCPSEQVYVLCYTRSAKKLIEDRIDEAVVKGYVPSDAKNICILTFDSYATYFLMALQEQGEINFDFTKYNYNERIRLFNKYISKDDFEDISYFIVDEIQDLVNDRAEMVLNILKYLECGYLLAGDRCQAIYDYSADNDATLDSIEFYRRVEEQFPEDILRYEIAVNRRQNKILAKYSADMRDVILNKEINEQNRYAQQIMRHFSKNEKIEKYIRNLQNPPSVSTAILCRSNGEAEYISGLLCRHKILHILNRGVDSAVSLPKWIADIFWDYCSETISKNDFTERFAFRCDTKLNPDKIWESLCRFTDSYDITTLSVTKFISVLSETNNIPNELYEEAPLLTVSTIHKAKGSEFDKVILIDSDIDISNTTSAEEARIRYVAITRPKCMLTVMKKNNVFFRRTASGRIIKTNVSSWYKRSKKYCGNIVVGLKGDIDSFSFLSGDFEKSLELQEYIVKNVRIYDELSAVRSQNSGKFEIIHNGHCIGTLSDSMTDEIKKGIDATDYRYNLPDTLMDIYVSGITTEILNYFDSSIPAEFHNSKIFYGIQITGLAKLNFEKR